MLTNELKKGDNIKLRNGWNAKIEDNLKGNTRLCTVYGMCTEMGSVYSHDIMWFYPEGDTANRVKIEHTANQLKCKAMESSLLGW